MRNSTTAIAEMTRTSSRTSTPRFTFQSIPWRRPSSPRICPRLQGEEKERRVIVDGGDVIGVGAREGVRIIARNQAGKWILAGLRRQIERIQLIVLCEMPGDCGFFFGSECGFLGQHDDGNAVFIERSLATRR